MLAIRQNNIANQSARYLNLSYDALGKSVNRLSSGLRIMSAADDAAGLAVRELMRADIGALTQGRRNAMDGVSMLQTAEAGLGQMDELLVRMRELAEQASTGTYTTDQKRTIQNEFDSLAEEINRIAEQMDFNGINLLNMSNSVAISIGDGPNTRGKFITIDAAVMDAAALRIGGRRTYVESDNVSAVISQDDNFINFGAGTNSSAIQYTFSGGTYIGFGPTSATTQLVTVSSMMITLDNSTGSAGIGSISLSSCGATVYMGTGQVSMASVVAMMNSAASQYANFTSSTQLETWEPAQAYYNASMNKWVLDVQGSVNGAWDMEVEVGKHTIATGTAGAAVNTSDADYMNFLSGTSTFSATFGSGTYTARNGDTTQTITVSSMMIALSGGTGTTGVGQISVGTDGVVTYYMGSGNATLDQVIGAVNSAAVSYGATYTQFAHWMPASASVNSAGQYSLALTHSTAGNSPVTIDADSTEFSQLAGTGIVAGDFTSVTGVGGTNVAIQFSNAPSSQLMQGSDWVETTGEGVTLDLVNNVCPAVSAIDWAINTKDMYRAYLGYTMNRLTSVTDTTDVQILQLSEAESRISDVDVAYESANMTKNMVLAQAGVSMLSMANNLPQMALSLLNA